jgi:putative ABC transport system substrate-binding protein
MNNRRKLVMSLGAGAFAVPFRLFAQQPNKVARIGYLGNSYAAGGAGSVEALRAGLRDLGYVEGKNIAFEFRWAEEKYERLSDLATELVRLKVDVLVTGGTPAIRAASQATSTIPIVMATSGDAVATGLVTSLARPGGNVTGSTFFGPELSAKRLELLKEAIPRITRVAVLQNPDNVVVGPAFRAMETTAKALKVGLQTFSVRKPGEFESAFAAMVKQRIDAVVIDEDALLDANSRMIVDIAMKKRLPASGYLNLAEAGGMIGYGANRLGLYRRAAYFVDKILKGSKPADIPVEQPTKFELVVNLKTAKTLGIKIPNSVLVRADKALE